MDKSEKDVGVAGLSFLDPARPQPWASFIEQIDRVAPYLGKLSYWLDTLKHPKRVLAVSVPIRRDDGKLAGNPPTG